MNVCKVQAGFLIFPVRKVSSSHLQQDLLRDLQSVRAGVPQQRGVKSEEKHLPPVFVLQSRVLQETLHPRRLPGCLFHGLRLTGHLGLQ